MLAVLLLKVSLSCGVLLPITSACRTPAHNAAVGGVSDSKHLTCRAIDVGTHFLTVNERKCVIQESKQVFTKVIVYDNHLHLE